MVKKLQTGQFAMFHDTSYVQYAPSKHVVSSGHGIVHTFGEMMDPKVVCSTIQFNLEVPVDPKIFFDKNTSALFGYCL